MAHVETFSCNPADDRDIIDYLNSPGRNKSHVIKAAIRFYMQYGSKLSPERLTRQLEDLPQILAALEDIKGQLKSGVRVDPGGEQQGGRDRGFDLDIMSQMEEL